MDTTLLIIIICYLIVIILCLLSILLAPEVDENERIIEPIKITPERKEVSQIVGATKSERLMPPPPKEEKAEEKKNPAQVPPDDEEDLLDEENKPMDVAIEGEYDPLPTQESLPEMGEVISINDNYSAMEVENRFIARHTCLDFNQIENTSRRVVRGKATEQDRDIIVQLEGTDIFSQIQTAMTTTNLELVRSILNNT